MNRRIAAIVFSVFSVPTLVAGAVSALPSITSLSGTVEHGSSVTIGGSDFGAKPIASPYRYDNFEAGVVGTRLLSESEGGWFTEGIAPVYSLTKIRKANTKSAYQNFTSNGGGYNSTIGLMNWPDAPMYFSGWFNYRMWGAQSRNNKLLQLRAGRLDQYVWEGRFGADYSSVQQYVADCDGHALEPPVRAYAPYNNLYADEQWHRMEFYIDQGTVNGNNGQWTIWIDGQVWSSISGTFMQDGDCPFFRFYLGFYFARDVGDPTPQAERYWDELYVDITRARVEIGNAPTWAACTHREIQVPSTWNGNSITFRTNQGTFADATTAYVYVVDASGAVNSQGYPVVFAGTDPGSPGQPGQPIRQ